MSSWWVIGILVVLLVIEVLADKIPVVDSTNDAIQTFVRPVAGAILFAASANVMTDINPVLSLGAGLLTAGGVHATKSIARPVVTATTAGTGNWAVSSAEDVTAFFVSLLALFLPIVGAILLITVVVILLLAVRRWRQKRPAL